MKKPVVFAGPSIFELDPALLGNVDLRPPAAAGDILEAVFDGADVIGLIDGMFDGSPSVWHKEILAALSQGIAVLGAASMGALRAAECHQYGMVGIGKIFSEYRDGIRTADADVAVLHAPAELDYRPLTVAMADVDATIDVLATRKIVDAEMLRKIGDAARSMTFRARTWREVLFRMRISEGNTKRLHAQIEAHEVSQKRIDACALIEGLSDCDGASLNPERFAFEPFNQTDLFVAFQHRILERRRKAKGAPAP